MVSLLPKTLDGLALGTRNEQPESTGWETRTVEEMGQEGRRTLAWITGGVGWAEEQSSSREDRLEETVPDSISAPSNPILHRH